MILSPNNRDDATYDEFASGDNNGFRQICYSNSEFRKHCENHFPIYDKLIELN